MLIGIDGNEANEVRADLGAPAGVNVYAFELLRSIHKLQDEWKGKHGVVVYLKRPPSPLLPRPTKYFQYKVLGGRGLWIVTKLTPYLLTTSQKPDVVFSPSHYTPPVSGVPKVASIMDLAYLDSSAHLKKKDFWQLKYWTAISIKTSKRLIAISESTKKDIVRHYPSTKGKVVVTHLGYDPSEFNTKIKRSEVEAVKAKFSIGFKGSGYVLYLGVLKPSKNVDGLVSAWSRIVHKYPKYRLVIAGKKGWLFEDIFDSVKKLGLTKKVIFTDYVPEKDKPALIAGSKVFVLPSFSEGFGLDILNAMACGVPVILSKVGALPEVAGNAGTYFDPHEVGDIAQKLDTVLSMNKNGYNKLVEKSVAQAKKFSWEITAKKTLKVLEEAAS